MVVQFSDGVGYDWVDGLRDHAARMVSDADWEARSERFPTDTPRTREYYLLRTIFASHFPHPSAWQTVPKVCRTLLLHGLPECPCTHCGGYLMQCILYACRA